MVVAEPDIPTKATATTLTHLALSGIYGALLMGAAALENGRRTLMR
jgi:hypothetical protein